MYLQGLVHSSLLLSARVVFWGMMRRSWTEGAVGAMRDSAGIRFRSGQRSRFILFGILLLANVFLAACACSDPVRPDGQYVTDWLVAGPLGKASPENLCESLGGASAVHSEGEPVAGGQGQWRRYFGGGSVVNLRELIGYEEEAASAAAFCRIESDVDQAGRIYCGTDNGVFVWLNGEPVLRKSRGKDETLSPASQEIRLRRGSNECLVICSISSDWLFGFTFRVDGAEATVAPPMVWNPLSPGFNDGRYVLFSPDWKWRVGDDPAWARPDFDDSGWERVGIAKACGLKAGTVCWMRVHARFTPESVLIPYSFNTTHRLSSEIFVDGVSRYAIGSQGAVFSPFRFFPKLVRLPQECVLAIRHVVDSPALHLPRIAVRRADADLEKRLREEQPQRFHRIVLIALLAFLLVFYRTAFWQSPRRQEGTWYCLTLLFACVSILVLDMDQWTDRVSPRFFTWVSLAFSIMAAVSSVAMSHAIARREVSQRIVWGFGLVGAAFYMCGFVFNHRHLPFLFEIIAMIEYWRVWICHMYLTRRPNRWYVGAGILIFLMGFVFSLADSIWDIKLVASFFTYAHAYGLIGFMGCMLVYLAREYSQGMKELQALTAELEERVEQRTLQVRQLTQRLITAQEDERERIARELHDSVAQTLWFAKMEAEAQLGREARQEQPHKMVDLLDHAIAEVRTIAYGLRPPELDKLGFVQAIAQCCKDFSYNSRIMLDYKSHGVDNVRLSPAAEVNVYRVLQEALNNVQQHAKASKVRVRLLGAYPSVILRVEDDGQGFDVSGQRDEVEGRMGIRGMEERIRLVGGKMSLRSAPGQGVSIVVEAPQQEAES